jgi:hypothetical protein
MQFIPYPLPLMEYLVPLAVYLAVKHLYPLRPVVRLYKSGTVNVIEKNDGPGRHGIR